MIIVIIQAPQSLRRARFTRIRALIKSKILNRTLPWIHLFLRSADGRGRDVNSRTSPSCIGRGRCFDADPGLMDQGEKDYDCYLQ
jgi:hypothetical protein